MGPKCRVDKVETRTQVKATEMNKPHSNFSFGIYIYLDKTYSILATLMLSNHPNLGTQSIIKLYSFL